MLTFLPIITLLYGFESEKERHSPCRRENAETFAYSYHGGEGKEQGGR